MVSSSEFISELIVVLPLLAVLVFVYAAYWAFDIRKALAVPVYRRQALGIGLVSLGFALLVPSITGNFSLPQPLLQVPILILFFWIDVTVLAARRSDPLVRDILQWRRVRIVLWALEIIAIVIGESLIVLTGQLFSNSINPVYWILPTFITFTAGAVYLPFSALRSKDNTFRKHLGWFGLFLIVLLVGTISSVSFAFSDITFVLLIVTFIIGGYCLYRGVRSLVPLNKLPIEANSK